MGSGWLGDVVEVGSPVYADAVMKIGVPACKGCLNKVGMPGCRVGMMGDLVSDNGTCFTTTAAVSVPGPAGPHAQTWPLLQFSGPSCPHFVA